MNGDSNLLLQEPGVVPPLYREFRPVSLGDRAFRQEAADIADDTDEVRVAYERENGLVVRGDTRIFRPTHPQYERDMEYLVDNVNAGLVSHGAGTVWFSGPRKIGAYLEEVFSPRGSHAWVADLQAKSYGKFGFEFVDAEDIPEEEDAVDASGGRFDGNRIGFDLGASDFKVTATVDGAPVYSRVFGWKPKDHSDPRYHIGIVLQGLAQAAEALPKVDAIGGSSSGVWVNSRMRIGNLARAVGIDAFNHYLVDGISNYWPGVPLVIMHDGHVTALEGGMLIAGVEGVLGGAMGSHYGAGYVDTKGGMKSELYEHAFVRVDRNAGAPVCEWSKLPGIGGEYFSQIGVENMRKISGISLDEINSDEKTPLEERLKAIRARAEAGDDRAVGIFESIGVIFGYSIPTFIDLCGPASHVIAVGRVVKGAMGDLIVDRAEHVLKNGEFGDEYGHTKVVNTEAPTFQELIDQKTVGALQKLGQSVAEVGQSWAAASLPIGRGASLTEKEVADNQTLIFG